MRLPFQSPDGVRRFLAARSERDVFVVIEQQGRIVGNGGLHRFDGRRDHAAMLGMGVHDDFTRRGIGTAILHALLDAADNWLALKRIELSVFVDNEVAVALYRKHGFQIEGTARALAFRDGAYVDAHMMARLRGL
jgi:putative acetyltransferase